MDECSLTVSAPKKISSIQFGLLSPREMARLSEISIQNRDMFTMPSRNPAPLGVLDARMGVSDKQAICETCKLKLNDCSGHFGCEAKQTLFILFVSLFL